MKFKTSGRIALGLAVAALVVGVVWFFYVALRNPVDALVARSRTASPAIDSKSMSSGAALKAVVRAARDFHGDFLGSESCRDCHAEIFDRYQSHPMSRSLTETIKAGPLEDYTEKTRFRGVKSALYTSVFEYRVQRDEKSVWHIEQILDADENVIGELSREAAFAVGSGRRGRSYLMNHGGLLYMSPITWYSHENCWDLSPAYSRDNQHFERRIVDGCVACHAGRTSFVPDSPDRFDEKPFHENSIGCERCHGPGETHRSIHTKTASPGTIDEVVNPASFDADRLNALCFQCHLHGVGRVPHLGLNDFSFQPGDLLSDVWSVYVHTNGIEAGEAATQGEQMMASKCYSGSDGKMTCIACHDPHGTPAADRRVEYFKSKCQTCHDGSTKSCSVPTEERLKQSQQDSCIECHMPRSTANSVPHTALTDHRVLRRPDTKPSDKSERRTLVLLGNDDGRITEDEAKRARSIISVRNAEVSSNQMTASASIDVLRPWLDKFPDDIATAEALGAAYSLVYDLDSARTVWEAALNKSPQSERLLMRLMLLCHDNGDLKGGIEYGRRLLAVNPLHADYHGRMAHMLAQDGRTIEGIPFALRAAELSPWEFQIHGWLAEAYALQGDQTKAAHHRSLFEKLRPVNR